MTTLQAANLFYRRPDLYDQARGGATDDSLPKLVSDLAVDYAPRAKVLLDLGCGTASDLEGLTQRFECVGVDLQPQLIDYAHRVRPTLDIRVGDMRSFRLGKAVDIVLCAGSALAYLHTNEDLAAAFNTFAAHSHPGTLLIICTQVAPVVPNQDLPPLRIELPNLHATRSTSFDWDLATQLNTMHRHWCTDDGTEHSDTIVWRVTGPRELALYATNAGFRPIEIFTDPDNRWQTLDGAATAWFVATQQR